METHTPASICDSDIPLRLHSIDAFAASFTKSLHSLRPKSQETAQSQVKLDELKAKLREAEDNLVKALGVKTRGEAKRMALTESIASVKGRVEDFRTSVDELRAKNEEYATIVSQQQHVLVASEQNSSGSIEHKDETQEAISWYNRVLGFHVEGGHGVKFTFKNVNVNNPNEEYFFTIRHEDDTYTLLNCEPSLKGTNKLVHELNKTNGLFKFVRIMRKRFQEAAAQENGQQESSLISDSAPVLSISTIRSYSPTNENEHQGEPKIRRSSRRVNSAVLSPGSASSIHRSPRLKARK
ncbi:unnamed protein product [Lupinus luteus]|uniref:Kinetochore protein SPC25 n=1 Tax=Lupinus luteus TaxID=3873 RepID=A0AAV1Y2H9_LUPLU